MDERITVYTKDNDLYKGAFRRWTTRGLVIYIEHNQKELLIVNDSIICIDGPPHIIAEISKE